MDTAELRDRFGERMRYVFRHRPLTDNDLARCAAELAGVLVVGTWTLVDRGAAATLIVEAPGRREATLWLRAPGEEWRSPLALAVGSKGYHPEPDGVYTIR